jgi:regulator of PEP synthase PpsR (kinase-PPPase family)
MLGHSLLTQFEGVEFSQITLPFIDSVDKAQDCLQRIERESLRTDGQPIVFSTLVNSDVREVVRRANALFVDFFETFIGRWKAASASSRATPSAVRTARWTSRNTRSAWRRSTSPWRTTTAPRTASSAMPT